MSSRHSKSVQHRGAMPTGGDRGRWALVWFIALLWARMWLPEDPGQRYGWSAPLVMFWLVAGGGWLLWQLRQQTYQVIVAKFDLLLYALMAWQGLRALMTLRDGCPRPAWNSFWEVMAQASLYFVARQLITTRRDARLVFAAMIAVCCGLATWASVQKYGTNPQEIEVYERLRGDTVALYYETGHWMPPESSVRKQFENRLYSNQPTAQFALTNTLAGLLASWSGVLFMAMMRERRWELLLPLTLLLWGLAMTESRAAWLALLLVGGLGAIGTRWFEGRFGRFAIATGLLCATLASIVYWLQETPMVQRATRSLFFRFEYWQATLRMIADFPLLGIGPGQFQDFYVGYKRLGASEEVHDPHNLLLEIWAIHGLPALLLTGTLVVWLTKLIWPKLVFEEGGDVSNDEPAADRATWLPLFAAIACGIGIGGLVVAMTTRLASPVAFVAVGGGATLAAVALSPWVVRGELSRLAVGTGLGAMGVNLLAAGSLAYPCLTESILLQIAVAVSLASPERADVKRGSQRQVASLASLFALLIFSAFRTEYFPVMNCRRLIEEADASLLISDSAAVRQSLESAVLADPLSDEAARRLLMQRLIDFRKQPQVSTRNLVDESIARVVGLVPGKSDAWLQVAQAQHAIWLELNDESALQQAIASARQATRLYPTRAKLVGFLATFLRDAGEVEAARQAAIRAFEIDRMMEQAGHRDRLLTPELRQAVAACL